METKAVELNDQARVGIDEVDLAYGPALIGDHPIPFAVRDASRAQRLSRDALKH